ncbi:MAG TPA: hypothetical protein VGS07_27415 [Thermoanaerobaculia bacterium]|jgi:hypothetical protein|nr:hypothetical protein [Thermoanaerobaculia bacterium]
MAVPDEHLGRLGQFGWGLAGAVSPSLIRAFSSLSPESEIPHLGWAYIIVTVGVFGFGGVWSIAMGSDKFWKAMYNGATFPLVFGYLSHVTIPGGH